MCNNATGRAADVTVMPQLAKTGKPRARTAAKKLSQVGQSGDEPPIILYPKSTKNRDFQYVWRRRFPPGVSTKSRNRKFYLRSACDFVEPLRIGTGITHQVLLWQQVQYAFGLCYEQLMYLVFMVRAICVNHFVEAGPSLLHVGLMSSPQFELALFECSSPVSYVSYMSCTCFPGLSYRRVAHVHVFSKLELQRIAHLHVLAQK